MIKVKSESLYCGKKFLPSLKDVKPSAVEKLIHKYPSGKSISIFYFPWLLAYSNGKQKQTFSLKFMMPAFIIGVLELDSQLWLLILPSSPCGPWAAAVVVQVMGFLTFSGPRTVFSSATAFAGLSRMLSLMQPLPIPSCRNNAFPASKISQRYFFQRQSYIESTWCEINETLKSKILLVFLKENVLTPS